MNNIEFTQWMRHIASAANRHCHDGMYTGVDGAKRFAREVGVALPDFSREKQDIVNMKTSTYSGICVIAYNLRPPIDAKDWYKGLDEGINAALAIKQVPKPDNYRPAYRMSMGEIEETKARWRAKGWIK